MAEKGEEPEKTTTSNPSAKLSREERKKLREKKRVDAGFPTKMNKYLYFVLIFTGIVTFFDGWSTMAITLAMGGFGGGGISLEAIMESINNQDIFTYFGLTGSPVMMGIILSLAGIGVVAAVSFKYLVDKYGRRPLTLWTALAFISFSVLTSFSPPGGGGLILFLIFRICANYFLSADISTIIIAEESPSDLRGRLVGAVLATNTIGGFTCGVLQTFGVRLTVFGINLSTWQSLFFLTSVGYFLIIPMFFFLKETKRFTAMKKYEDWRKKRGLKSKTSWLAPLKSEYIRPMTLGCIMGFLATFIAFAQVTFFALYFNKEQNMSSSLVGILTLPLMLSGAFGYYSAGSFLDKWGRVKCIHVFGNIIIWSGAFFAWPTLFVAGDIPNPYLMLIVVLGGMVSSFSMPIMVTASTILPLEMFPTQIRSTAMGWIGAIARGGTILAPFIMMFGAEALGGLGLTYQFMFRLMGVCVTTILFTAYLLAPESKGRMLEEIVISETYGTKKEISKKEYNKPYYFYAAGVSVFFTCFFTYGIASGGTILNLLYMMGFYTGVSIVCLIIVHLVRKKLTKIVD